MTLMSFQKNYTANYSCLGSGPMITIKIYHQLACCQMPVGLNVTLTVNL